ncbi:MAG: aspartate aminotransferase family protein [Flavobacteriales bacterium]|nr:aspartate aminotransferase family protein [Flavobacteriales bacterium]
MELFDVYPLFDIELVKAKGCHVWDDKGTKYLDLYGGHGVISIGHAHPAYTSNISDQVNRIGFYSNSVQIPLQKELATKLGELSGCDEYALFLCSSGAEANENALKAASFTNGRKKIIAFKKGFHGRTSAAVAATDTPSIIAPINETDNVIFLELNDADALKDTMANNEICAIIIEGIQGIGGIYVPDASFLELAGKLCKENGAFLILDEVQSGYGRSGKFFAFQHSDVKPDIISMAKGMGNGFPIGGVLIAPHIKPKYGMLGTTFGGNHLACAAGVAVLDVLKEEKLIENSADLGNYLKGQLVDLIKENGLEDEVAEIRGNGLMLAIELKVPCGDLRKELLFSHQIFTGASSNKNTIRLLPPLSVTKEDLDYFASKFIAVLSKTLVK